MEPRFVKHFYVMSCPGYSFSHVLSARERGHVAYPTGNSCRLWPLHLWRMLHRRDLQSFDPPSMSRHSFFIIIRSSRLSSSRAPLHLAIINEMSCCYDKFAIELHVSYYSTASHSRRTQKDHRLRDHPNYLFIYHFLLLLRTV